MPQDPLKVDALQIEPGSGQTLKIERDAATGALKFTDNVVTGGILLNQLSGLRSIGNVRVVGKSGAGAAYTTIQSALDTVPSSASASNPYLILVMPGQYDETVNIVRDGVHLVGIGKVILRSALEATPDALGNDHTLIISAQLGTTPLLTYIENITIRNAHTNKAAVRVVGADASTLASTGVFLHNCDLQANAAGGNRALWATTANNIYATGGKWEGGALGLVLIEECGIVRVKGVDRLPACSLRYDSANDEPSGGAEVYDFADLIVGEGSGLAPVLTSDLDGGGVLRLQSCVVSGNTQLSGDQGALFRNSHLQGNLTMLETAVAVAYNVTRSGTLNTNAGSVLDQDEDRGTRAFAGTTTGAVTFSIPRSDDNYTVALELDARPANDETPWITNKLSTGFTITFQTAQTLNVRWKVTR